MKGVSALKKVGNVCSKLVLITDIHKLRRENVEVSALEIWPEIPLEIKK